MPTDLMTALHLAISAFNERRHLCTRRPRSRSFSTTASLWISSWAKNTKCDPAVLRQRAKPIEFVRMLPNLRLVAAPEFLPTRGIMPEPLAQSGAGRDVLHPFINGGIGLFHSARP